MAFLTDPSDPSATVLAQPPAPSVAMTQTELVALVTQLKADLEALRAEYDAHVGVHPTVSSTTWTVNPTTTTTGTTLSSGSQP